jgi:hypothetical protein
LPGKASLPPCERDARVPSTRDAGSAGVPPAILIAREKTYPFEEPEGGGQIMNFGRTIGISLACVFVRFGAAIGIIPTAEPEFTNPCACISPPCQGGRGLG